ncbi:MAG TPA: hypothetical protein VHL58_13860 [Thermoanaerobaculia bacterium]|nr:hypothetical protein [Thermoanaerobaculia bacterium]
MSTQVKKLADGRFQVEAKITAAKRQAAADGTEREVPLDEMIDVALFHKVPDLTPSTDLIATQRQRLRTGTNEVTFVVNQAPAWIAVDPWILRIDRNRFDNSRRVE